MTSRKYLYIIWGVAILGWISLWLVLTRLEPCTAPGEYSICHSVAAGSLFLLFLSITLSVWGTFVGLGFLMRYLFNKEIYKEHLNISIRQGILLTISGVGALGLLLLGALTWWSGLLMIGIIVILEYYFSSME